jgi:hypothetical protein
MMTEPQLHERHEDFSAGEMRIIKMISLFLPLFSQLAANFLKKDGKLIKLLLALLALE